MPIPALRVIVPTAERNFGRFGDAVEVPPLTDVQTRSYERFLHWILPTINESSTVWKAYSKEIFPIESYDKKISLEYVKYELGKPRYDPGPMPPIATDPRPALPRLARSSQIGWHCRSRKKSISAICLS